MEEWEEWEEWQRKLYQEYFNDLIAIIADLERIKRPGVSKETEAAIDAAIEILRKEAMRATIADLERIKRLGVSEEAEAEIDAIIERYRETIG